MRFLTKTKKFFFSFGKFHTFIMYVHKSPTSVFKILQQNAQFAAKDVALEIHAIV